jgi:hypothetical protein
MNRWRVLLGLGATALVTGSVVAILKPSEAARAIQMYSAATCVSPRGVPTGRMWNNDVPLSTGTSINVAADSFIGSVVSVRYPDGTERHVPTLRDYVYPYDIRLTPDSKSLWILNSGLAAGIWHEAHLYEYDISTRILVHDLDVDPDDLPEPCPVTTTSPPSRARTPT